MRISPLNRCEQKHNNIQKIAVTQVSIVIIKLQITVVFDNLEVANFFIPTNKYTFLVINVQTLVLRSILQ